MKEHTPSFWPRILQETVKLVPAEARNVDDAAKICASCSSLLAFPAVAWLCGTRCAFRMPKRHFGLHASESKSSREG